MTNPCDFQRRVLLSVTGLSAQVVTETIYALGIQQTPRFIPTELIVLTTTKGAARVRLTLQGSDPAWLARLCRDYDLPQIQFAADDLRVLRKSNGDELEDIATEEENMAAADMITETIRTLTADPDCALHVSMAGGRKTLGFFAAYALSLYGRSQDRLSHVLVEEAYEGNPNFHYPTPYTNVIYTREGVPLDTRAAKVLLAEIPFVPLRDGLPEHLRLGQTTYRKAVEALRQPGPPAALTVDMTRRQLIIGDKQIKLPPSQLAFYAWVARYSVEGQLLDRSERGSNKDNRVRDMQHSREYLAELGKLLDSLSATTTAETLGNGMTGAFVDQTRSKINGKLKRILDVEAMPYLIDSTGGRRMVRLRLPVAPGRITLIG